MCSKGVAWRLNQEVRKQVAPVLSPSHQIKLLRLNLNTGASICDLTWHTRAYVSQVLRGKQMTSFKCMLKEMYDMWGNTGPAYDQTIASMLVINAARSVHVQLTDPQWHYTNYLYNKLVSFDMFVTMQPCKPHVSDSYHRLVATVCVLWVKVRYVLAMQGIHTSYIFLFIQWIPLELWCKTCSFVQLHWACRLNWVHARIDKSDYYLVLSQFLWSIKPDKKDSKEILGSERIYKSDL